VLKQKQVYRFGDFRLEPEERALFRGKETLRLTGKAFDVLVLLVKNHNHLVPKTQIISHVWPDTLAGDNNLDVALSAIRNVLKENLIQNVARQGYRFTGAVTERLEDGTEHVLPRPWIKYGKSTAVVLLVILPIVVYFVFHLRNPSALIPPRPGANLYQKALEYEHSGDDEQALTTLDEALAVDPLYDEACVRAAYLAYELEDMPKATTYLQHCAGRPPQDSALYLKAQALSELLADNSTKSIALFQLLIDKYPQDVDALYRFAEVATNLDRVQEADNAVSACLKIDPRNPYCRFQLMYVRLKQNRFDDVIADYKALPAGLRDYPWFDEPLGVAFMGKDQISQAREAFERLARVQTGIHGSSHFTTGKEWQADVMLYEGHVKDATRRIQELMETSDNASSGGGYLVYLGRIYALSGDNRQAVRFASQVSTAPGDTGDLTAAAVVLASAGDADGSERLLKIRGARTTALLSPTNDHLIRGLLAVSKGSFSNGIEEIRLAHDLHPWDEETTYWLGMAYLRSGDYKSALDMFQNVRRLKGTVLLDDAPLLVPLVSRRIGECYERLGDSDAAKPYYAEVARMWASADEDLRLGGRSAKLTIH
jgi:DNA-binding winged helix-turn-helix (wHTH) protein/Flp pilus assembly protein TadD